MPIKHRRQARYSSTISEDSSTESDSEVYEVSRRHGAKRSSWRRTRKGNDKLRNEEVLTKIASQVLSALLPQIVADVIRHFVSTDPIAPHTSQPKNLEQSKGLHRVTNQRSGVLTKILNHLIVSRDDWVAVDDLARYTSQPEYRVIKVAGNCPVLMVRGGLVGFYDYGKQLRLCKHHVENPKGCGHVWQCGDIHMCPDFLLDRCGDGPSCSKTHKVGSRNRWILERFGLKGVPDQTLVGIMARLVLRTRWQGADNQASRLNQPTASDAGNGRRLESVVPADVSGGAVVGLGLPGVSHGDATPVVPSVNVSPAVLPQQTPAQVTPEPSLQTMTAPCLFTPKSVAVDTSDSLDNMCSPSADKLLEVTPLIAPEISPTEPEECDTLSDFVPTGPDGFDKMGREEGWDVQINTRTRTCLLPVDEEWKDETDWGQLKILEDSASPGKRRIAVRTETVTTVCCNHTINEDMAFDYGISSEAEDLIAHEGLDKNCSSVGIKQAGDLAAHFLKISGESAMAIAASCISAVKSPDTSQAAADSQHSIKETEAAEKSSCGAVTSTCQPIILEPDKAVQVLEKQARKAAGPKPSLPADSSHLGSSSASDTGGTTMQTTTTPSFGYLPNGSATAMTTTISAHFGHPSADVPASVTGLVAATSGEKRAVGGSPDLVESQDAVKQVGSNTGPASGGENSFDGRGEEAPKESEAGEGEEEKLFEERAEISTFDKQSKTWKERGNGGIKIVKNEQTGEKYMLMRCEQGTKPCADFMITVDMMIRSHQGSGEQLFIVDGSAGASAREEPPGTETFLFAFKNAERTAEFKRLFERKEEKELGGKETSEHQEADALMLPSLFVVVMFFFVASVVGQELFQY